MKHCFKTSGAIQGFVFLFSLSLFLSACSTTSNIPCDTVDNESLVPSQYEWTSVAQGIDYAIYKNSEIPLIYHLVKIDLTSPSLKIKCYPEDETDIIKREGRKTWIYGKKTKEVAIDKSCTVAVNTTPYGVKNKYYRIMPFFHPKYTVSGIHRVDGVNLSHPVRIYGELCFKKNEDGTFNCEIIFHQNDKKTDEYDYAFGGFYTVLENDQIIKPKIITYNSRTVTGTDRQGKTLFILVCEGENKKKSMGLSGEQTGFIMKKLGCTSALNMDGGTSSSLYIAKKNVLSYRRELINGCSFGFALE